MRRQPLGCPAGTAQANDRDTPQVLPQLRGRGRAPLLAAVGIALVNVTALALAG